MKGKRGNNMATPEWKPNKSYKLGDRVTVQRIRHLPVTKGGALQGIISIGDVVKQRLEEVQSEVEDLQRYIRSP